MSAGVLFDAPGPRTVRRHRIYTALTALGLLAVGAFVVWRLAAEGELAYSEWEPLVTPRYMQALLNGLIDTVTMAVSAIVLSIVLGIALGLGKLSDHGWVRWPCWAVVEFFRAVPLLLLMIFFFYLWFVNSGSTGAYWSVVLALMLYNGAVLAEVFRAGINAVPAGQSEAAYALGMRKSQVVRLVQLPQAVKIMLPAIISQMVVILKDTSLGYAVLAPGLSTVGRQIYTQFGNQLQTVTVVALLYITLNLLLTWVATLVQKRLVGEKSPMDTERAGNQQGGA